MAKLKKLNNEQTAYFCEQLWLIVNTGMPLDDGLDILAEDVDDDNIKALCDHIADELTCGKTLFNAMATSGVFPQYAVSMVEIGCVTGRIDDVLKSLSEYYENRSEIQRTVRYAVFHPCMLLLMMTIVMVVLVVKVIPMFSDIFAQFDAGIGDAVSQTVSTAYFIGQTMLVILAVLIVVICVITLIRPVRMAFSAFFAAFPLTRRVSRDLAQAKLADAMSMMICSGIAPEEALEHTLTVIEDKYLRRQLEDCLERVKGGEYFSDAICNSGILPKVYARSLRIAYTSGSFDEVWKKISRRSSETAQNTLSGLVSFVEPAIIIVLALMIGSILMTIMLPLMNIMTSIG
ncbi:MAG: type II secretion system F family protein [Oscillospiraceae bacterium]|nr:type II secretion system F family protein [Oscillospiraceae bacterium]